MSSQTIRRDISELDRTGMLERRPGGASCRTTILNSTYDARQVEDFKDKERIARTIAEYIPDNSSIFLTLGTTVEVIAYALLERSGLMVITNNVVAALTLTRRPTSRWSSLRAICARAATALWGKAQSNSSTVFSAIT